MLFVGYWTLKNKIGFWLAYAGQRLQISAKSAAGEIESNLLAERKLIENAYDPSLPSDMYLIDRWGSH